MADSARTTREKAAEARAAAVAEENRRRRRTNIGIGLGLVLVIGLIIGGAVFAANQNSSSSATVTVPSVDPKAALPTTVLASTSTEAYGVPYGTLAATKSTVQVWEDFQCPICAQFESAQGAALQKLAADGKIYLVYRPASFIDANYPASNLSSARATSAWGCAINAGVGERYHNVVFANQPTTEGAGYTDDQLIAFGKDAGLSGAAYDSFAACVPPHTYLGWAANSAGAFRDAGVPGTPAVLLDGNEIPAAELGSAAAYIDQNRKK